ncbi:MAG: hypothetical protein ABJA66_20080 [Actinomycetota bacterium]
MKKLFRISFLIAVLCFVAPVYADGDMTTGDKTCTQNCSGLIGGTNPITTTPDANNQDDSAIGNIYTWVYNQISDLLN